MSLSLTKTFLLHNKTIVMAIIMLILMIGLSLSNHSRIKGALTTLTPSEIISISNATRQSNGLEPLHPQPELMKAAEAKANAMVAANAWSHNTPTETPWQFIQGEGYSYSMAGENLAKGFDTADSVVAAWLNSPSHRANLLSGEYTDTGVAVIEASFQNQQKTTLVVQFLARRYEPLSGEFQSQEANQAPLLVNSTQITKSIYFLFGLSGLFIGLYLLYVMRIVLLRRRSKSKPPDSTYWKR